MVYLTNCKGYTDVTTSLSDILGISSSELKDQGAFDPLLDSDTLLFIDPHLLKHTEIPELEESYPKFQQHFINIAKLLSSSTSEGDVFWNRADKLMTWPEVKGLCIGYASKGTAGSGIGKALRRRLLLTAKQIIDKGFNDPELFELVGIFEDDFGPDRISDMTANVIRSDLANFTRRVMASLSVDPRKNLYFDINSDLPINPLTGETILLVPETLLRDLPVSLDWSNLDTIAAHNEELRISVNEIIGSSWREAMHTQKKETIREAILEHPDLIKDLINQYCSKDAQPYNFLDDRAGEYIWRPASKKAVTEHPLSLSLGQNPTIDQVYNLVISICNQFKYLIENNGWWQLLHEPDGTPKREKASQLLFYGVADAYCEANQIMIARESDAGRGPVDFKFGTNQQNSILVEIKKSTNTSNIKSGIKKQLPIYLKAEKSKKGIYLIIDVGYTKAAIDNLNDINRLVNGTNINIFHIDGQYRPSASKA